MKEVSENTEVRNLLIECEKGDQRYQEKLYKHFYGYAMSISRLYTYSTDDAVSIMNDSFLKVFAHLKQKKFDKNQPFKYYLRRVLINTAIDNYRRNQKHSGLLEIEKAEHLSSNESFIESLQAQDIIALLDQLPYLHRMVFNMYEIQGYKHHEIAALLEVGESTSRVFLTRAKKKLRVLIKNLEDNGR